jgi:hypothetical protein
MEFSGNYYIQSEVYIYKVIFSLYFKINRFQIMLLSYQQNIIIHQIKSVWYSLNITINGNIITYDMFTVDYIIVKLYCTLRGCPFNIFRVY